MIEKYSEMDESAYKAIMDSGDPLRYMQNNFPGGSPLRITSELIKYQKKTC